jgi:hypothetical protein
MVAGDPHQGGATWAVLQYVLGLRRLGHEITVVEPVAETTSGSTRYFADLVRAFHLEGAAALLLRGTRTTVGLQYEALARRARESDVLLNISGLLADEALTETIPIRVYLDLDPGFNQLWHAAQGIDVGFAGHTHWVTVGHTIGTPACAIPTCGYDWIATWPPVVLEQWPVADAISHDAFTTVGNWRAYGSIDHGGRFYGQKAHSLREFLGLPALTGEAFLLGLAIHPAEEKDLTALAENGWGLVDPSEVARTPADYRRFVQGSRAEFAIAKSGYVVARCGWFSDRSACYLASGRPVLAQETGFSKFLPTGEGLFSFESVGDAVAAAAELRRDYRRHSRAARALAEEYFDSDRVLTRLLRAVGAA